MFPFIDVAADVNDGREIWTATFATTAVGALIARRLYPTTAFVGETCVRRVVPP
jgi:hypothetical protein